MLKWRAVVAHAEHGVLPQHGVGRRHRHRRGRRRSGLSAAVGRLGGGRQGREVRRNQLSIQRPGTPQFHRIFAAPSRGFLLTNADMTPTHWGLVVNIQLKFVNKLGPIRKVPAIVTIQHLKGLTQMAALICFK